jgi:hypothetical protein
MFTMTVTAAGVLVLASGPAEAGPACHCRDIYEPVICGNGQVYSNICYARCAGAHHCVSYGG